MKKTLIIAALAAMAAVTSCKKDQAQDYPEPAAGTAYILEGTVSTPGFTWVTKSSVGLYAATDGVTARNLECKIEGWADTDLVDSLGKPVPYTPSQYEGQATAPFNTPALDLVKGENEFFVYTPYAADMTYSKGKIYGLEISSEQTQPKPNVAGACFAYGTCKGIPGVDAKFPFTLNPVSATAKITVSTSEFAGYGVSKVTIWDQTGNLDLGGGFNVDVTTNKFQTLESYHKVATTVLSPVAMQGSEEQSVYVNILPGEFPGLYFVVELSSDKGTVTIPVQKTETVKFVGGQTTEIKFTDLKASDNKFAWYCPEESRMQSGLGYAYGEANTYLIQCKNGSTYTGATYSADASIPDEVTIDYRARGDFFAAVDPTGAEFEWFKLNSGAVYTTRTAGYEASGVVVNDQTYTFANDAANYKVKVKNSGSFAGTPILVMKKAGKILWAWTFWNIAADGTRLESVQVGSYKLANMDLGQPTTQYEKWIANKSGNNPDVIFRNTFFYQWGRPIPVFWTTFWNIDYNYVKQYSGNGNVPGIEGPITLSEAVEHPVGVILAYPNETNLPHWDSEENRAGLWGGNSKSKPELDGSKSLYDPCPKGWRVPDANALTALSETTPTKYSTTAGMVGFYIGDVLFPTQGYGNGKTASNGRLATMGSGATGTASACSHGLLWSNYLGSNKSNQPKTYYYRDQNNKSGSKMATYNGSVSAAVRCQVDTDNR